MDPAISTPVGPPPITTKFKYSCLISLSNSFSAFSKAFKRFSLITSASFIPLSP